MPDQQKTGPIIASHHVNDPWRPRQEWLRTTTVQWGARGIVLGRPGTTAFFEAFPKDGTAGFIRGEGETLEEAEESAYRQWFKHASCLTRDGHRWTRTRRLPGGKVSTYTNGGAFCLRCGAFACVMRPIVEPGAYRAPLDASELDSVASGFCRASPWGREDAAGAKWRRRMELRARRAGIDLPPILGPRDPGLPPYEADDYEQGCRKAVGAYLRQNREALKPGGGSIFDGLSVHALRRLMEEVND
jgi:hypothetical protein